MNEVYKKAMQKKKQYRREIYAMVFGFAMMALLTVLLDYLLSFVAIIMFPMFVLPYYIAMQTSLFQLENLGFDRKKFNGIKRMAMISPMFRSGFKTLVTFILSAVVFYGVRMVTLVIFNYMPQYHNFVQELIKITSDFENYYANIKILSQTYKDQYNFVIYLTQAVSYGLAFLFFVIKMIHNSLYALCKNNASLPNGNNQPVFKETFAKYKKSYYKMYYSKEWYKILLVILVYAGGAIGLYYLELLNFGVSFATGLAIIALCFLIPDTLLIQEQMYICMFDELSKRNAINMQKIYSDIKDQQILSEEQQKEFDKFIDNLREAINNEKKDDDSDDNDKGTSN